MIKFVGEKFKCIRKRLRSPTLRKQTAIVFAKIDSVQCAIIGIYDAAATMLLNRAIWNPCTSNRTTHHGL